MHVRRVRGSQPLADLVSATVRSPSATPVERGIVKRPPMPTGLGTIKRPSETSVAAQPRKRRRLTYQQSGPGVLLPEGILQGTTLAVAAGLATKLRRGSEAADEDEHRKRRRSHVLVVHHVDVSARGSESCEQGPQTDRESMAVQTRVEPSSCTRALHVCPSACDEKAMGCSACRRTCHSSYTDDLCEFN